MVPCPVLEPGLHDLELKREESVKQVRLGVGGLDRIEDGKEIGAFGRGLVEEPETGET